MIRRRANEPPAAPPPWRARFDAAVATVRAAGSTSWLDERLDALATALELASRDDARLAEALATLDPDTTARRLKDALRARQLGGLRTGVDHERTIDALRQRHATVNELMNRRDALAAKIDAAVADVEILAVRHIGATALSAGSGTGPAEAELDRIRDDIRALELARVELEALGLTTLHRSDEERR